MPKQQITIPFAQGLDQKTDPKHMQHTKLLLLENGEFDKLGKINKRNGFSEITASLDISGTSKSKICSLNARRDELICIMKQITTAQGKSSDSQGWKVYSLDGINNKWREIGRHIPLELKIKSIGRPEGYWIAPDMAEDVNGYRCYVWADDITTPFLLTGIPYCSIVDTSNYSLVVDAYDWAGIATGVRHPKVIAVDDSFHIWIGPGNIALSIVSTVNPTSIGAFIVKTPADVHADKLWDACYCGNGPGGQKCSVIAYKDTTPDIKVRWFREDGTQVAVQTIVSDPVNCVSCARLYDHYTGNYYIGIFWKDNATNDVYAYLYNENSTAFWAANRSVIALGAVTVLNITGSEDPSINVGIPAQSSFRIFSEIDGIYPPWTNYITQGYYRFDEVGGAVDTTFFNACLASKAFTYGHKSRVWTTNGMKLQGALYLRSNIGTGNANYVINTDIKALQDKGQNYSTRYPGLPQVVGHQWLDNKNFRFATVFRGKIGQLGYGTDLHPIKSIIELDFEFENQKSISDSIIDNNLHLAGGLVGEIDDRYQETGFHIWPELDPTNIGNIPPYYLPVPPPTNQYNAQAAGGFLADGEHYFRFTYEWTDREGQLHRSAPSPVYIVTLSLGGATQLIGFRLPYLHYGALEKLRNVKICTYRMASDGLYHKEDLVYDNVLTIGFVQLGITPWSGGVTSDANLLDNEILYTEGGIIENIGPPASNLIAARKDRLFLVPDEDRQSVWISKIKNNGEGIAFSDRPEFIKRIPTGGDIFGIGILDDKVLLFKENEIRAFSGPGPNDLGVGSFSDDFLVAQDVGCIDKCSIHNIERGIVFKGRKGHYLLDRGLQSSYIGMAVSDYKEENVTKTISIMNKNQIRFIHDGYILVLDSLIGQWSKFTHPLIISGCCWKNKFIHYNSNWKIYEENSSFTDAGADIIMKIETGWIKTGGIHGYQRIFLVGIIGDYKDPHTLNVEIYKDYENLPMQTIQKVADVAFGSDIPYQIRFRPKFSRCQAMKFKIYDSDLSANYESMSLSGISLVFSIQPGLYRDKPNKTL